MKARFLLCLLVVLSVWGCRKELLSAGPEANLEFSSDSIFFDTVFTSVGSVTRSIKVFNRGKRTVKISEIKLFGGKSSNFRTNINGQATDYLENVELAGKDSLNVFVKVTISPNSELTPFFVTDSIGFLTNGNQQRIILQAYGQNATFFSEDVINSNVIWDSKIPYVLYKSVKINPTASLTIKNGTKLYFHKDAEMIIAGTLHVQGDVYKPVLFSSDRLEQVYANESGQWGGLHFLSSSKNNLINYAVIKNAIVGIRVDSLSANANPKLLLTNTKLSNMELVGMYGYGAEITGFNNIISNCGKYLVYGTNGGFYNLKHNTFANSSVQSARSTPGVFFTNQNNQLSTSAFSLSLINNIIWGNLLDELIVERKGMLQFSQAIRNNLIKTRDTSLETSGNIRNQNPRFKTTSADPFSLSAESPAANKGENLSGDPYYDAWLNKDFLGDVRIFPSDLGSYEIF